MPVVPFMLILDCSRLEGSRFMDFLKRASLGVILVGAMWSWRLGFCHVDVAKIIKGRIHTICIHIRVTDFASLLTLNSSHIS